MYKLSITKVFIILFRISLICYHGKYDEDFRYKKSIKQKITKLIMGKIIIISYITIIFITVLFGSILIATIHLARKTVLRSLKMLRNAIENLFYRDISWNWFNLWMLKQCKHNKLNIIFFKPEKLKNHYLRRF